MASVAKVTRVDRGKAAILSVLEGAREARSRPRQSEAAVQEALRLAPHDLDVLQGAYKFYFYNNRLTEALPLADRILSLAARRLNISPDWREVRQQDADFASLDKPPRLYLQTLLARSYLQARLGALEESLCGLAKIAELDSQDRFGAARLAEVIRRGDELEE